MHERTGYVLDPHSAVAYRVATRQESGSVAPLSTVVLATAHPAKFPEIVEGAVSQGIPLPPGLARAMEGKEHIIPVAGELREIEAAIS